MQHWRLGPREEAGAREPSVRLLPGTLGFTSASLPALEPVPSLFLLLCLPLPTYHTVYLLLSSNIPFRGACSKEIPPKTLSQGSSAGLT